MSNVVPPSLVPRAAATHAAPTGVPGTVANPPPAVAQLASGTILRGTVIRQDARNHALVRTDLGTLEVHSNLLLPAGSQLTLQLRTAGSQLHITIMQVDGHPVHAQGPSLAQAAGAPPAGPPAAPTVVPDTTDVLALGQRLGAVLQALPAAGAPQEGHGALPPRLDLGSRLHLRVLEVRAPGAASVARPAGGARILGVITGTTASGHPLAETSLGTLALELETALPKGLRLLFELEGNNRPRQGPPAGPGAARPTALAFGWPALEEAVHLLQHLDEPAAEALRSSPGLPRPGPRLASTILFFLQALGGGNLSAWLGGQVAEAFERANRGDLLLRLNREFAELGKLSETAGGDWRFLPIPLFHDGQIHQLRLFLRRRHGGREGAEREQGEDATRFVLDVALSRFGDMQLDGLVRDRRFDLILRTRRPLPEPMRRDITDIFNEANGAAGHKGQIGFQASDDWTFMPLDRGGHAVPEMLV